MTFNLYKLLLHAKLCLLTGCQTNSVLDLFVFVLKAQQQENVCEWMCLFSQCWRSSFDLALTDFAKYPLLCVAHKAVSHGRWQLKAVHLKKKCASLSATVKRLSISRVPSGPHTPRYYDLIQCIVLQGLAAPPPPIPSVTGAPIKVSGLKLAPHVNGTLGGSKLWPSRSRRFSHYRLQHMKLTSDPFTQRSVRHDAEDIKASLMEQHQILYIQLKEKEISIHWEKLTQMAVLHVHTSPGSSQFQTRNLSLPKPRWKLWLSFPC